MFLPVKNILFATDFSENANYALRYALSLTDGKKPKVHVLHVAEPLSLDATVTFNLFVAEESDRKKAIKARHEATKNILKENQKKFLNSLSDEEKQAYSYISSVELLEGHPAEAILNRAEKLGCDLIVMASHEQNTKQTFLGTIVKRVLRRSSIPVLVVPPNVSKG